MYFLNEAGLRADLAAKRVPAKDLAIYVFLVVGVQIPIWDPTPTPDSLFPGWSGILAALASWIISICGFVYCYRANGGRNGEDFAERFVSLAWVCVFQLTVTVFPFYYAATQLIPDIVAENAPFLATGLHLIYYLRLSTMFGRLHSDLARTS
ncbi:MAG: hypothetical protein AB8G23_24070 [Myxococcota bacterium]